MPSLTASEFVAKWSGSTRTERAASQEHFIDLCRMLGFPTPNEADATGDWYAFEKGAEKTDGGDGFADVWKRGHFAWEYKGKKKDLDAAYKQLLQYRESQESPPLLVVCDLDRFVVRTNFTGTATQRYEFSLADLAKDPREPLRILRAVVGEPEALRPVTTRAEITEQAAREFASLASALRSRGHDPHRVAHFLNKLLFCMFAEDTGLLPKGLLKRLAEGTRDEPVRFAAGLTDLFEKMSNKGGLFGPEPIEWFNGGLFDGADVIPLERDEIAVVRQVSELNWSEVEPAIFGTLFERGLDPDKRSQLGAHYTDRESIRKLVDPVVMEPLRREFEAMKARVAELLQSGRKITARTRPENDPQKVFRAFLARLRAVKVLDPACGSGNFLYITLQSLKDLEQEVIVWGSTALKTSQEFPRVGPQAVHGIEINVYAAELARVTIWIGHIQWMLNHGLGHPSGPVLQPLENIECRDSILHMNSSGRPSEPEWPETYAIVGNPPFLGGGKLRSVLGDEYVESLFELYGDRLPNFSDLCCYWFEKARAMIEAGKTQRVGLLATQAIRGGANRRVLDRIGTTGSIFMAWADEQWILDGAAVRISFVGFDDGSQESRMLDGKPVSTINSNLSVGIDLTQVKPLKENLGICFMGPSPKAPFDISADLAGEMLQMPGNVNGRPNSDVVRPVASAVDLVRRPRGMWTIDFGLMEKEQAAKYELPFEYVKENVLSIRSTRRDDYRGQWWQYARPRPEMRIALQGKGRFIATPAVSKHRIFVWMKPEVLCNQGTLVFARDDDYTFGVLHSRAHELWARGTGTQLREAESGFRYTPTTTFETFPFPQPTHDQREMIASSARDLNAEREAWLNPPGIPEAELKARTLTNLYNARPTWLAQAHERLDRAVLGAYGWPHDISNEEILTRLLALNLEREAVDIEGSRPRKGGQGTQQRTRNRRAGREQLPLVADPKEKYGREEESD